MVPGLDWSRRRLRRPDPPPLLTLARRGPGGGLRRGAQPPIMMLPLLALRPFVVAAVRPVAGGDAPGTASQQRRLEIHPTSVDLFPRSGISTSLTPRK